MSKLLDFNDPQAVKNRLYMITWRLWMVMWYKKVGNQELFEEYLNKVFDLLIAWDKREVNNFEQP